MQSKAGLFYAEKEEGRGGDAVFHVRELWERSFLARRGRWVF